MIPSTKAFKRIHYFPVSWHKTFEQKKLLYFLVNSSPIRYFSSHLWRFRLGSLGVHEGTCLAGKKVTEKKFVWKLNACAYNVLSLLCNRNST